jgi:hypothetical protein
MDSGSVTDNDGVSISATNVHRFPGRCGYREVDTDSDSDEVPDCDDAYPQDPAKILAGK